MTMPALAALGITVFGSGSTLRNNRATNAIMGKMSSAKVWQIVGEPEADAHKGKISMSSPMARALIGKTKGAIIEVEAPSGAKWCKGLQSSASGVA
jgi:transcription elongation factor GreA